MQAVECLGNLSDDSVNEIAARYEACKSKGFELFDKSGTQEEANHLPLDKVSIELKGEDAPHVEILLTDNAGSGVRHFTYTVAHVRRDTPSSGASGHKNALEIEDKKGALTILRIQS